jgi:hypothetical protein
MMRGKGVRSLEAWGADRQVSNAHLPQYAEDFFKAHRISK